MPGISTSPLKPSQNGLKKGVTSSNTSYNGPEKGTCHQCRQMKLSSMVATCKVSKQNKSCTMRYCEGCLWNRYGEEKKVVSLLDDWRCPRCRGICNCSHCRNKQGLKPTGILVHTARENGFSCVAEMLCLKGPENMSCEKTVKETDVSLTKAKVLDKHELSNGDRDDDACSSESILERAKASEGISNPNMENSERSVVEKKKFRKQDSNSLSSNGVNHNSIGTGDKAPTKSWKTKKLNVEVQNLEPQVELPKGTSFTTVAGIEAPTTSWKTKKLNVEVQNLEPQVELPKGTTFTTVAGIELLPEEVGDALQFIEFCSAFGEVLDIKKGQAKSIIRELARGRSRNCGQYSSLGQIHVQLLSLIQKNMGKECPFMNSRTGKNSWLLALGELVSQSQNLLRDFPSHCFDRGADGYEMLSTSKKLKLLNFICDEAICTNDLRLWIDNQNAKFIEREKEAREKVNAARDKKKELKKRLQNEVAQALIGQNGATSYIAKNEAAIAQIKGEVDKAHAEMLAAVGTLSKKKHRSDALRTESVLLEDNGRVFWRLNGHTDEPDVLLQDLGAWDAVTPHEKWFAYNAEQKREIEKYVFSSRTKKVGVSKVDV